MGGSGVGMLLLDGWLKGEGGPITIGTGFCLSSDAVVGGSFSFSNEQLEPAVVQLTHFGRVSSH